MMGGREGRRASPILTKGPSRSPLIFHVWAAMTTPEGGREDIKSIQISRHLVCRSHGQHLSRLADSQSNFTLVAYEEGDPNR